MSKRLKEKIEELEKRHRFIADNLLDAIWVVDVDTLRYEYITPSIKKISGYSAEEFMNFTIKDRLTDESFKKVSLELGAQRKRFEKGAKAIKMIEIESIRKDGSVCWIEIKAKFIKETDGRLKIVGVSRDIDARKRAEQEQNMLMKELGAALEEKEKLLKEVKVLRGLLPICSGCKRIRDEQGRWWPIDAYVKQCTDAKLTHTICPDCKEVFYRKS